MRVATVQLGRDRLDVPVAETPEEWRTGLNGFGRDTPGMLFVMPSGSRYAFHLDKVPPPIGVAWFDEAGLCVDFAVLSAERPVHRPAQPYTYVLEMPISDGGVAMMGALADGLRFP